MCKHAISYACWATNLTDTRQSILAVSAEEFASFYWQIISTILPRSIAHPGSCKEFFEVALRVFWEANKSDPSSNEDQISSCLQDWASILLNHIHREVSASANVMVNDF